MGIAREVLQYISEFVSHVYYERSSHHISHLKQECDVTKSKTHFGCLGSPNCTVNTSNTRIRGESNVDTCLVAK